jgi:uncharacterized Tic20 family protein
MRKGDREMSEEMSKVTYDETAEIPVRIKAKNGTSESNNKLVNSVNDVIGQERFWATLAHAMGPVMIALFILGDGLAWCGLMMITAGIYLYFTDKSPMIKFHARQALAAQMLGTFGWIILLISGTLIWVVALVISIILILLLIGIILTPLVFIMGPVFWMASFALPLSVALFGSIGAWEAWHGRDYRYPYLAKWLDEKFGATGRKEIMVV